MKTELTRDDLLKNITATRTKLEELKNINSKLGEVYKEPITGTQKQMIAVGLNVAWLIVFSFVAVNFPGYHLALFPVLYWLLRGSKVAEQISKALYKKHLQENEGEIDRLFRNKGEVEYELKTISMLEKEFHDITMLRQFETYLQTKQAITMQKCVELYKEEQKQNIN